MTASTLDVLGHAPYISPTECHPRLTSLRTKCRLPTCRPSAIAMPVIMSSQASCNSHPTPPPHPAYTVTRPSSPHFKYPPEPPRSAFSGVYMPTLAIDGSVGVRSMRQRKGAQGSSEQNTRPATQRALQLSGVISKSSSRTDAEKKHIERRRSIRGVVDLLARTL